ncbi:MAG: radical SAM protein [Bacilli bacterium]|nr:radical SAM protein [Bacilli bacterium]MDD4407367.1 radical SAM protein [Bacilli bacterium]
MKELTMQIKPVGNHCNLKCKYCYAAPFKSDKYKVLDLKILEKIIKESLQMTNKIIITWHGGEPTMVGLDYFKEYIKIVKKYKKDNQEIYNMIQTNATLITDNMADFFKDNKFIVSVSLDGNEDSHNKNRINNIDNGSFNETIRGIEILRQHGINPPLIATVTKNNFLDGIENFDFFINKGFTDIKYSPVYDSSADEFSINNDEWFNYLKSILYCWLDLKNNNIKIREIDEILSWFANKNFSICANNGMCAKWISIDENGNIYPCEYMRVSNMYGNINNINLIDIFQSENYKSFVNKINYYPPECKKCKLFNICHNGCPATRVDSNENLTHEGKYVYCKERLLLFKEIEKILNEN